MKSLALLIAFSISLAACSPADQPAAELNTAVTNTISADAVYTNGRIYTVNEAQPWAEAFAIKDGKFLVIGSADEVTKVTGDSTEVIDLDGQFVMPGLIDTHTHPIVTADEMLNQLLLDNDITDSLESIQEQLVAYVEAHPEKTWIEGGVWPKGLFPGENPHRRDLDAVVPDVPVCLLDQGGHAVWCNTLALETAGIMDKDFQPPQYAIIERDDDGVPSGTLRETALRIVKAYAPTPSLEDNIKSALFVQELFNRAGVTGQFTASGTEEGLRALQVLAEKDEITLHWAVSMDVNFMQSRYSFDERMAQIDRRGQYESEWVDPNFAKIFTDGDISGGIKLLEPYEGTDNYGQMSIEVDELQRLTRLFDSQNIGVHFHTIGSGSIEEVTKALEAAAEANGGKLNTRHYPDHMGLPNKDQLERLAKVNGVIGFAPSFAFTTPGIHDSYRQFIGERVARLQPLRWALDAGAVIGVGTDWAAVPQVPFPLLEGVVHRRNPYVGKTESEANNAALGITVAESIRAYTLGGAYAIQREDRTGSLETGKYADFIVLDRNLLEIDVDDISEAQVLKTVFNGKVVYDAGQ